MDPLHGTKPMFSSIMPFCLQKQPQVIGQLLCQGAVSEMRMCVFPLSIVQCMCVFPLNSPELEKARFFPSIFPMNTLQCQCRIMPHTSLLFFYCGTQEDSYIPKLKIILSKDKHRCLGSPHQYSTEQSTHLEKIPGTLVRMRP